MPYYMGMRVLFMLCLAAAAVHAQKAPGFDLGAINRNVDPCTNFYQYACGGWMTANPLPGDASRWGRFDALQDRNRMLLRDVLEAAAADGPNRSATDQKIGDFYAACMDEKSINARGLDAIQRDLNRIALIQDREEITELAVYMFRIGSGPFFRFGSEQDAKDSTRVIAVMDQGGLGLPDRDYYLKTDEKSVDLRNKYLTHVQKVFELLGLPAADAQKKAAAVLAIETELAKGSMDRVARRDPEKVYHKLTAAELSKLAPSFDWVKFFQSLGAPPIESLNVAVPDFARTMNAVLEQQRLDDLKTYLTWALVRDNTLFLPAPFQQASFEFYEKTLRGAKEMRPRWKRCVDLTDQQLPDALGKTFVEKTLGEAGKKRTQQMVAAIEKALEKDIRGLDWMTPKTKDQAIVKLHGVTNKIGNKSKWLDYSGVQIARNDPYANSGRTSTFELARQLAKIGKPVDKTEWEMSQPTVNAYYDPQHNDINFPAGILQPPFWDNTMDDAVNYGAIGAVIGHELTHGFDDQGRQFDAKGNLRDWWTDEDAKAFEQRTDCVVNQYNGYSPVEGVNLNGKLTLGENTADNGGLRLAYAALMDTLGGKQPPKTDGFSAEQRFFLGWAQVWCQNVTEEALRLRTQTDPHSPGEFRVNGVVSNMPEFQKAFACRASQPMVRGPACRVW
ncbi:MAG: Endothelin-converting enzyme 1 [Bryobacterales bacterium]|nr:Endothelin-converting enzyme 1 [Bryobacterales bacterium]